MIFGMIPIETVIYFSIYSLFSFYLQLHVKEFKGESEFFRFILSTFTFLVFIAGFAFLIYLGVKTTWWIPVLLFIWSFVFKFFGFLLELVINKTTLSLLGFIICPIIGFLMFSSL